MARFCNGDNVMVRLQVLDTVRVKPRDQIILYPGGKSQSGLYFADEMYECCGREFVLREQTSRGHWYGLGWYWDSEWLEFVGEIPKARQR